MFYDLNIPWPATSGPERTQLPRTLHFLRELGYDVVALNHMFAGKLPGELSCVIPDPLPYDAATLPNNLTIKRRITLVLSEAPANARMAELGRIYDLVAVRPVDERSLAVACGSIDCDIISLDLSQRLPFHFRHRMLGEAVSAGKKIEICYAAALAQQNPQAAGKAVLPGGWDAARRNLISNATQIIRATRGRGLVLSSEARSALACRAPLDVVNLAVVWGLAQEKAVEALSKDARSVLVTAKLKSTSYRGVVDVVYGGEKASKGGIADEETNGEKTIVSGAQKRKADGAVADGATQPMSKRQMKRLQKEARAREEKESGDGDVGMKDATSTPIGGEK